MSKTILVPVDGSEHSRKAVEFAAELCEKYQGKLTLLHVAQPPPRDRTMVLGAAAITVRTPPEGLQEAGAKAVEAARRIATEQGCAEVETLLESGDPAKVIIDHAKRLKADMVVMGSRGLGDLAGLVMGSVSHKVNHLAPCTCITVR